MTPAERTKSSRPNWVEARAQCTIYGTFHKLGEAIRHDLSCFNKMPNSDRGGRQYRCDDRDRYCLAVTNNFDRDEVMVRLDDDSVEVLRSRVVQFVVRQKWNPETLACDLFIGSEQTCIWKVSQKAIGDFMFPSRP